MSNIYFFKLFVVGLSVAGEKVPEETSKWNEDTSVQTNRKPNSYTHDAINVTIDAGSSSASNRAPTSHFPYTSAENTSSVGAGHEAVTDSTLEPVTHLPHQDNLYLESAATAAHASHKQDVTSEISQMVETVGEIPVNQVGDRSTLSLLEVLDDNFTSKSLLSDGQTTFVTASPSPFITERLAKNAQFVGNTKTSLLLDEKMITSVSTLRSVSAPTYLKGVTSGRGPFEGKVQQEAAVAAHTNYDLHSPSAEENKYSPPEAQIKTLPQGATPADSPQPQTLTILGQTEGTEGMFSFTGRSPTRKIVIIPFSPTDTTKVEERKPPTHSTDMRLIFGLAPAAPIKVPQSLSEALGKYTTQNIYYKTKEDRLSSSVDLEKDTSTSSVVPTKTTPLPCSSSVSPAPAKGNNRHFSTLLKIARSSIPYIAWTGTRQFSKMPETFSTVTVTPVQAITDVMTPGFLQDVPYPESVSDRALILPHDMAISQVPENTSILYSRLVSSETWLSPKLVMTSDNVLYSDIPVLSARPDNNNNTKRQTQHTSLLSLSTDTHTTPFIAKQASTKLDISFLKSNMREDMILLTGSSKVPLRAPANSHLGKAPLLYPPVDRHLTNLPTQPMLTALSSILPNTDFSTDLRTSPDTFLTQRPPVNTVRSLTASLLYSSTKKSSLSPYSSMPQPSTRTSTLASSRTSARNTLPLPSFRPLASTTTSSVVLTPTTTHPAQFHTSSIAVVPSATSSAILPVSSSTFLMRSLTSFLKKAQTSPSPTLATSSLVESTSLIPPAHPRAETETLSSLNALKSSVSQHSLLSKPTARQLSLSSHKLEMSYTSPLRDGTLDNVKDKDQTFSTLPTPSQSHLEWSSSPLSSQLRHIGDLTHTTEASGSGELVMVDSNSEAEKSSLRAKRLRSMPPHQLHSGMGVVSDDACGTGNYTAEMTLSLEEDVLPGDFIPASGNLRVVVNLKTNNSRVILEIKSCCLSPSAQPDEINTTCCTFSRLPMSPGGIHPLPTDTARKASFTINLFQMINSSTAYLHCDLQVCLRNHSECERQCFQQRAAQQRSEPQVGSSKHANRISFGPMLKDRAAAVPQSALEETSSSADGLGEAGATPVIVGSVMGCSLLPAGTLLLWLGHRWRLRSTADGANGLNIMP